jgi:hypothetical protein
VSPVRSALTQTSALQGHVKDGLGAIAAAHHAHVEMELRPAFGDSLDIDAGLLSGRESEHRWDYLLGHGPTRMVIALEPHSAKQDQVSTVIRKKQAAMDQLRGHLRDGVKIARWFWVASGDVQFADTERERRRLDQHGIEFIGKVLRARHVNG